MITSILKLGDTQVTLLIISNNQLVWIESFELNETLLDNIFSVIQPYDVAELNVVFPGFVSKKLDESLIRIDKVNLEDGEHSIVLRKEDKESLQILARACNIPKLKIFTNFDYYRLVEEGIIVDEFIGSLITVTLVKNKNILTHKIIKPPLLKETIDDLIRSHGIAKVISSLDIDIVDTVILNRVPDNLKLNNLLFTLKDIDHMTLEQKEESIELFSEEESEDDLVLDEIEQGITQGVPPKMGDFEDFKKSNNKLTLNINKILLALGIFALFAGFIVFINKSADETTKNIDTDKELLVYYEELNETLEARNMITSDYFYSDVVKVITNLPLEGEIDSILFKSGIFHLELSINESDDIQIFIDNLSEYYNLINVEEIGGELIEGIMFLKVKIMFQVA